MKRIIRNILSALMIPALLAALSGSVSSCNSSADDFLPDYKAAEAVAITSFTLKSDTKVLQHLDSVFFSIDLDHGIIFNADSLPAGTKVNKLVPVVTYSPAVTSAVFTMTGGDTRTGTVDYVQSPSDSIDFTGDVTLRVATDNDGLERTYRVKVNVHKMAPDSLMWDKAALSTLPSRLANPKDQKTVLLGNDVISLIAESDGSYTVAKCHNPSEALWDKKALAPGFTPDIRSLTATKSALYMLGTDGIMHFSSDALTWTADNGFSARSIIGTFGDKVLAVIGSEGSYKWISYPAADGVTPSPLPEGFPTEGFSSFHSFTSKWAADPIGFFTGGCRDGKILADTWAFDGNSWAKISNNPLPPLRDASIIPYFNYKQTTTSWIQTEFSVCLCIGGLTPDGDINQTVYISYDNGVNWQKADSLLQLPKHLVPGYQADVLVLSTPKKVNLSDYWKSVATGKPSPSARVNYFIDGDEISWDCPYIYLFGGKSADGKLDNAIRRAVLARLTFAPLF